MARKDLQGRITIPKEIRDIVTFENYEDNKIVFFITEDSRVAFCHITETQNFKYEILATCCYDSKYRFFVPKNVATYLGNIGLGYEDYYFTTYLNQSLIYLYKVDHNIAQQRQLVQLEKLMSTLPDVIY